MPSGLKKLLVTGLGTGYLPIAPGTWGSAGTVVVFLLAAWACPLDCCGPTGRLLIVGAVMLVVAILSSIGCVALGEFAETAFGRKDPSQCTIDEWAGQAVTLMLLPLGHVPVHVALTAGVGFLAFRLCDIVKPPPARQMEGLPFGWGVLLDDLMAGVYANLISQLVLRWGFGMV